MKKTVALLVLVLALFATACTVSVQAPKITVVRGSGVVATESRNVSGFSALKFTGLGDVIITQGSSEALTIEAEDNIIPEVVTTVSGGTLNIGFKREGWQDWINATKPIKFNLTVKDLTSIESNGLGNVKAAAFKTGNLSLRLTGAGGIALSGVDVPSISTTLSGAGNVDLAGKVTDQTTSLTGLGAYRAGDLSSDKAKVSLSGAGSATVWAKESLDVTITGAGSVNYYGSPTVNKTITGIGSVKSVGNK